MGQTQGEHELGIEVRPIRKAFEQVHDQLREVIMSGARGPGERLPNEAQLADQFGVSRGTIREALRLLAAENLIRSAKGPGGGTFVTLPTVARVSESVHRDIQTLSDTGALSLDQFLEARELIESFAVRQAAERRTDVDLIALRGTIDMLDPSLTAYEQYVQQKDFHVILIEACGNPLLLIAAQPIFAVMHANIGNTALPDDFPQRICTDHGVILEAIEAGDPDRAEELMRRHLRELGEMYRTIWPR